jgi:hypothetical protein
VREVSGKIRRVGMFVADGQSIFGITLDFPNDKIMAFVKYQPGKETLCLLRVGDDVTIKGKTAQGDENFFVEEVDVHNASLHKETI